LTKTLHVYQDKTKSPITTHLKVKTGPLKYIKETLRLSNQKQF